MKLLAVFLLLVIVTSALDLNGYQNEDPLELAKKIYYGEVNLNDNSYNVHNSYKRQTSECAALPAQQYGFDQTVSLTPEFSVLTETSNTIGQLCGMSRNSPISVIVGVLDYCSVMNPNRDDRFYKAELEFDVFDSNSNKYDLCMYDVDLSTFDLADFVLDDLENMCPSDCVDAKVKNGKLKFDMSDILQGLYNKFNVLTLFTITPRSRGRNKFIELSFDTELVFTIPELRDVAPRSQVPSDDGNDYQDVFPGYTFEHVDTILGSDGRQYGRDVYWRKATQKKSNCAMIITDGMPTQAAIHYMIADNHIGRDHITPFNIWHYCDIYITSRPASGSNKYTPTTEEWSWNLYDQANEQAVFIEWVRDGDEDIEIMVLSHDRDSHASQENRRRGFIDIYVEWEGWFTGCSQARNATGECSNRWLAGGFPMSDIPLPACSYIGYPEWCTCTDNLLFTTFTPEFKDDSVDGHGVCAWKDNNYQYNYELYNGMTNPNSTIRQCLRKFKDPNTGLPAPADGFFLDGTNSVAYDFQACRMSSDAFAGFNLKTATRAVQLPQNVLDMVGYGNNLTHFNTPELKEQALNRRQFKMQDPRGAVFNLHFDNTRVVTPDGLTGPDMYQRYQISNEFGAYTTKGKLVRTYYIDNRGLLPYGFPQDWENWPGLHHLPGQPIDSHLTTLISPYSWLKKIRLILINEGFAPAHTKI